MAKARNYAYTRLSDKNSVRLEIGDMKFDVVQFVGSWTINQIPEALCMLAMGRDARNVSKRAAIHSAASKLNFMLPAKVFFTPKGDFSTSGLQWPDGEQVIFDGYFTGFSYPKINGKVQVVANLVHWLVDLGFTSCLSAKSHQANPIGMAYASVVDALPRGGGSGGEPIMVGAYIGHKFLMSTLQDDLWESLKGFLCAWSEEEIFDPHCQKAALTAAGIDVDKRNDRATRALQRIEGPSTGKCNRAYEYGRAAVFDAGLTQAFTSIANVINHIMVHNAVSLTMWDVLISHYLPLFQLDLYPAVDRAIIAPRCPGFRGPVWKSIRPNEYDHVDFNAMVPKPLRGVVVHGSVAFEANSGATESATSGFTCPAGVYASPDVKEADGAILYAQMPPWVAGLSTSGLNAGSSLLGDKLNGPTNSALNPDNGPKPPELVPAETVDAAADLMDRFARGLYIENVLRGRSGAVTGKLRLDIAPGSYLQVRGSPEKFIGGEDELAADLFSQVARVTVEINSEQRKAATGFLITHTRTAAENASDRTSIDRHPLYEKDSVPPGLPLVKALAFPEDRPGEVTLPAIAGTAA